MSSAAVLYPQLVELGAFQRREEALHSGHGGVAALVRRRVVFLRRLLPLLRLLLRRRQPAAAQQVRGDLLLQLARPRLERVVAGVPAVPAHLGRRRRRRRVRRRRAPAEVVVAHGGAVNLRRRSGDRLGPEHHLGWLRESHALRGPRRQHHPRRRVRDGGGGGVRLPLKLRLHPAGDVEPAGRRRRQADGNRAPYVGRGRQERRVPRGRGHVTAVSAFSLLHAHPTSPPARKAVHVAAASKQRCMASDTRTHPEHRRRLLIGGEDARRDANADGVWVHERGTWRHRELVRLHEPRETCNADTYSETVSGFKHKKSASSFIMEGSLVSR